MKDDDEGGCCIHVKSGRQLSKAEKLLLRCLVEGTFLSSAGDTAVFKPRLSSMAEMKIPPPLSPPLT